LKPGAFKLWVNWIFNLYSPTAQVQLAQRGAVARDGGEHGVVRGAVLGQAQLLQRREEPPRAAAAAAAAAATRAAAATTVTVATVTTTRRGVASAMPARAPSTAAAASASASASAGAAASSAVTVYYYHAVVPLQLGENVLRQARRDEVHRRPQVQPPQTLAERYKLLNLESKL
jgi:hypothetical protein